MLWLPKSFNQFAGPSETNLHQGWLTAKRALDMAGWSALCLRCSRFHLLRKASSGSTLSEREFRGIVSLPISKPYCRSWLHYFPHSMGLFGRGVWRLAMWIDPRHRWLCKTLLQSPPRRKRQGVSRTVSHGPQDLAGCKQALNNHKVCVLHVFQERQVQCARAYRWKYKY